MKLSIALASCFAAAATAVGFGNKMHPPPLRASASEFNGTGTFQQLIDHDDPSLGTFSQQFWYNDEFYKGPGSPVVLFTPGEIAAAGYTKYLTNATITGAYAQAIGGAVVMIEHRYWGNSSPYSVLSTKNMQYLTLNNSISDLTNFAKTAKLPFDTSGSSTADKAPWVLSGGSYSGALTAWTEATQPGTFWAYHASSAPVEAVYNMWTYFAPIQEGMAQNCSKDIGLVVNYMDKVLTNGTSEMKTKLKTLFGLQALEYDDDFMSVLMEAVQSWQENEFFTGYSSFFQLCDAVEGVFNQTIGGNVTLPGAGGVGLQKAINGYASYIRTQFLPGYCSNSYPKYYSDPHDVSCFDTRNATSPLYTDVDVDNQVDRQWVWFLCNEPFAYWQNGPPASAHISSPLASTLVQPKWNQQQCALYFPKEGNYTYGSAEGKTTADVNAWTGGWSTRNTTRLIWANGEFDPWRSDGVSSKFRPGGPQASTPEQPINIIPDGVHCYDLIIKNGLVNPPLMKIIETEIAQIKTWVSEHPSQTGKH